MIICLNCSGKCQCGAYVCPKTEGKCGKCFVLLIKTLMSVVCEINVLSNLSILDLKILIHEKVGLSPAGFKLMHNNNELIDAKNIDDYGINTQLLITL